MTWPARQVRQPNPLRRPMDSALEETTHFCNGALVSSPSSTHHAAGLVLLFVVGVQPQTERGMEATALGSAHTTGGFGGCRRVRAPYRCECNCHGPDRMTIGDIDQANADPRRCTSPVVMCYRPQRPQTDPTFHGNQELYNVQSLLPYLVSPALWPTRNEHRFSRVGRRLCSLCAAPR
jgi:hypothetical protein